MPTPEGRTRMEFLSDDPTYLAGGLALVGAVLLVALKVTQQGRFLVWACAAFGAALVVLVVERVWVTDNERIEQAVYSLARAVAASDVPGVMSHLDDDVRIVYNRGTTVSVPPRITRASVETQVGSTRFDFLRVTHLRTNAGGQSRRGTAEFRVLCGGSTLRGGFTYNFGSISTAWSLGLRETRPGVWKVNRITPVELPREANLVP